MIVSLIIATLVVIIIIPFIAYLFRDLFPDLVYNTRIYDLVSYVRYNQIFVTFIVLVITYSIIIIYHMRLLTKYINEIMYNAQILYDSDQPISFNPALVEIESQFLQIKNKIRHSQNIALEAEKRKNDLIVYLAHDLKTPLTSIIGYLDLLISQDQLPYEVQQKYYSIILNKSLKLEDLLNEFFEITRFNLSNLSLDIEPLNLTRMLNQMASEFEVVMKQKDLRINLNCDNDVMINADVNKFSRAVDNLLMNAYHYSFENSTIEVYLSYENGQVVLTICNHSKTIDREKMIHIFDQFFRVDSARSSNGGSGLGLTITKEIILAHQGTISAISQNNQMIFTIVLPQITG